MTGQPPGQKSGPESEKNEPGNQGEAPKSSPDGEAAGSGDEQMKGLTADEQMALFEKELKENDWGHQPC